MTVGCYMHMYIHTPNMYARSPWGLWASGKSPMLMLQSISSYIHSSIIIIACLISKQALMFLI